MTYRKFTPIIQAFFLAALVALLLSACNSDGTLAPQPLVMEEGTEISADLKGGHSMFPYYAEVTLRYHRKKGSYHGGTANLGKGSKLTIPRASLTPPPGTPHGADVTVSMLAEMSPAGDEIIFTFGPHGCLFSKPAEIKLSWKELNTVLPALYYIDDNGNYIPQAPDQIDVQDKWLKVKVNHFSRYALGAD